MESSNILHDYFITDPSEQESFHPKQDKRQIRGKRSTKHQSKLLDKDLKFNVKGEVMLSIFSTWEDKSSKHPR